MVKSKLIKKLSLKNPSLKVSQIKHMLDILFSSIAENLKNDKPVEIRSFGRWDIKKIKAKYSARNPKTGEKIYVPPKKKISFKMSKHLKDEINKK